MRFCVLSLLVFWVLTLSAQPPICADPAEMTSFCNQACIICDIDGFTGINNSTVQGQAPPGFCTTQVNHMQWIAFLAGSEDLTLNVAVSNCQLNESLEIGVYHSSDCVNFTLVTQCNTEIVENSSYNFINNQPLVVGDYYYFVMDGSNNDICNYTVTVLNGTTEVPDLTVLEPVEGQIIACPGQSLTYTVPALLGATIYEWTIDGQPVVGAGPEVLANWATLGNHEVCVVAKNACDETSPSCLDVWVANVPPTALSYEVCQGDCLDVQDTTICDAGFYQFNYTTTYGCDSLVQVAVSYLPNSVTNLALLICDGDTLTVAGLPFTQTGQYTEVLQNYHGCDSTINLDLTTIICEIQGDVATESVACFGGTNGSLVFFIDDGTPPFSYSWQKLGDATYSGNGTVGALNQNVSIPNLPQGTYLITVTDNFGNDAVLIGDITEAPPLTAIFEVSDFNGFGATCADSATATLTVLPAGGNGGFSYVWSNQATAADLTGLAAGTYTVLITDIAGCTLTTSAVITEPAPMVFTAIFTDPNCDGLETGSIALDNISGGVPPYLFSLNDADFAPLSSFTDLGPGGYTFTATDTNGCQVTLTGSLDAPIIPVIDLGDDVAIELGDNIGLFITCNILPDTIIWQPDPGLSCYDCLGPDASPLNPAIYSVAVSSEDDCWDADTITVNVLKVRDVFVPNTFTPNYDGHNDFFTVFGGNEVDRVLTFKVFDRWGELLFETADMPANDFDTGWDGRYRGRFVDTGIYVWFAEVRFIDGLTLRYEGDVNVLR